jgi:exosortase A-associated hydrolase 1
VAPVNYDEHALTLECQGDALVAVLTVPESSHHVGVLIIVGGPQYRVGSHRQFLLLARALASNGIPTFRFDYRGMGDGDGELRSFDDVGADIAAAITAFQTHCPQVDRIVLWGLCDGASAALLYWHDTLDPRVAGMVLVNPWVRSDASMAKTHIKHYYSQRLLEKKFWIKLLRGNVDVAGAFRTFVGKLMVAGTTGRNSPMAEAIDFQDRMAEGLRSFRGSVLLILSGRDLTAKEFLEFAHSSPHWSGLLERSDLVRHDVPEADHTFSSASWSREVEALTLRWLRQRFS